MNDASPSRQLQLFPDDDIPWETLPEEIQDSLQQLLSLLLEQAVERQLPLTDPTNKEESHV
jgi:hypothetical protein